MINDIPTAALFLLFFSFSGLALSIFYQVIDGETKIKRILSKALFVNFMFIICVSLIQILITLIEG